MTEDNNGYWNVGGKKIKKRYGYHEGYPGNIHKHQYQWDQFLGLNRYKRRKKKDAKLKKKYMKRKRSRRR